ncbi:hypothetical protein BC938DRAFT_482883 [Jimgerdemannia flammicorona]|uniref:Uncharacterized protein n=1 Tax=Jimgerdemannia flammicorona TaxID=994334 RepID=A0A433QD63_9FUNG|nr:hypothetical protein BC938DRAFT_482883 [Jimgerdemannia flammicorona]
MTSSYILTELRSGHIMSLNNIQVRENTLAPIPLFFVKADGFGIYIHELSIQYNSWCTASRLPVQLDKQFFAP